MISKAYQLYYITYTYLYIDAVTNRKLLGMLLSKAKMKSIEYAEDGLVAFNLVKDNPNINYYDIIFLDNTMPKMVRSLLYIYISILILIIIEYTIIMIDWCRMCESIKKDWI